MLTQASPPYIAVIGPGDGVSSDQLGQAQEVGRLLAERGAVVLTGGLGGIMEAASSGAYTVGGTTVGLLPGIHRSDANVYLTVALPTGLGEMRNALLVRCCDAVIAVGCSWGHWPGGLGCQAMWKLSSPIWTSSRRVPPSAAT